MFGRRVQSALFIDYENISQKGLPETVANWLAWFEDGEFDENKQRRRFIAKRVYWNSSAERHREKFEQQGFEVVLCEKFAAMKNGADIRMALDIIETTFTKTSIHEFVLVTSDSDFIPVLQKLGEKLKRTAVLVDEAKPSIYTAYTYHADIIVPARSLSAATRYSRPARGLLPRLGFKRGQREPAGAPPTVAAKATDMEAPRAQAKDPVEAAVGCVVRVTSRKPRMYTSQRDIEAELKKIKGFSKAGQSSYLGRGSYQALMTEIEKRSDRINVHRPQRGGTSVRYVPKDEE